MFEFGWTKVKKTVHPISPNSNYPVPPALKAKDND